MRNISQLKFNVWDKHNVRLSSCWALGMMENYTRYDFNKEESFLTFSPEKRPKEYEIWIQTFFTRKALHSSTVVLYLLFTLGHVKFQFLNNEFFFFTRFLLFVNLFFFSFCQTSYIWCSRAQCWRLGVRSFFARKFSKNEIRVFTQADIIYEANHLQPRSVISQPTSHLVLKTF